MTDELLREQVDYYRARAAEYDATSQPPDDPFAENMALAVEALRSIGPVDRAIELGAGTGQWTRYLAEIAGEVVAVDTSPEMLQLNAAKVPAANVRRQLADAWSWRPDRPAELVAFSALLSHVPDDRFDAFWASVGRMLAPSGRVFVFDESRHGLWREEVTAAHGVVMRTLEDGRRFRIVKVLWDPAALESRLAASGWRAVFVRRDPFYWGVAQPAAD